jgi:NADPH2:quinone reductase
MKARKSIMISSTLVEPEGSWSSSSKLKQVLEEPHMQKDDRVFAFLPENGRYPEYVACKEENLSPLSKKLTFSQGSGLYIPFFTAYRALVTKCHIKRGEILLVHGGSGAVGIAAVQIAKASGRTGRHHRRN